MLRYLEASGANLRDPVQMRIANNLHMKKTHFDQLSLNILYVFVLTLVVSPRPARISPPSFLGESWRGGYFCPCHGSRFDLAGRVFKGVPAPANLVIPPYKYVSDTKIFIGEETEH
jgi:ubiquinol-cytochrome c reductase iron-sulfur subunit